MELIKSDITPQELLMALRSKMIKGKLNCIGRA